MNCIDSDYLIINFFLIDIDCHEINRSRLFRLIDGVELKLRHFHFTLVNFI